MDFGTRDKKRVNPPVRGGDINLTQLWEVTGPGIVVKPSYVKILAGRSYHLSPQSWKKLYLSFKLDRIRGGVTLVNSLSREGLVTGPIVTTGGLLHLCVFNSTQRVVRLTPTTPLISILGFANVKVKRLEPTSNELGTVLLAEDITEKELLKEIRRDFADVCDLSKHPVLPPMARLTVRAAEVKWIEPSEYGQRTPYKMEDLACRFQVEQQLQEYIVKGYLRRAGLDEKVYMSPLLPIKKKDGSYRLTTDFRSLNAYFQREAQEQPDVWRKLWTVEPQWVWFAKLDLKDGFFGIPVDEELQRLFAFSWNSRRYCWRRMPQGWSWAPILFAERVAFIVDDIAGVIQFADDILIGAETKEELRRRLLEVFRRLQTYGLKVNLEKAQLLCEKITFLGMELSHGTWSLNQYLEDKVTALGEIRSWKAVERIIGVVSYARQTIPDVERLLKPVRLVLKHCKYRAFFTDQWTRFEAFVRALLKEMLRRQRTLALTGSSVQSFRLETDWAADYGSYLLFCEGHNGSLLCDIGSKTMVEPTSSFVGEMKALVWACKSTKALRGDLPLTLHTDNHAVAVVLSGRKVTGNDRRVLRLWGWLVANERYTVDFAPGSTNIGADLLSRPVKMKKQRRKTSHVTAVSVNILTQAQEERLQKAHAGHFGWYRTLQNLRKQPEGTWPGAIQDVKTYVKNCRRCNLYGSPHKSPPFSHWQSLWPNETVFTDFAGPWRWPGTSTSAYILVAVDGYSRYTSLYYCKRPTAAVVCRFLRHWTSEFGVPRHLFSDQATSFTSARVSDLCSRLGIRQVFSAARAHYSNGLVERLIQTLLHRIRRHGSTAPWPIIVSRVQQAYNGSMHGALGASPLEVFLGVRPNGTDLTTEEFSSVLQEAEDRTQRARSRTHTRSSKAPRAPCTYHVGDSVYCRTYPVDKLSPQWSGPHLITRRLGSHLSWISYADRETGPYHSHQLKPSM